MTNETFLMTLLFTPRLGPKSAHLIRTKRPEPPESLRDLLETIQEAASHHNRVAVPTMNELQGAHDRALVEYEDAERRQIAIMTSNHPHYSDRLKAIKNSPVLLFARGRTACLTEDAVAVVGTRNPSDYGAGLAEKFGAWLADMSFVVVSGLALGCDTLAHRGCLGSGGRTVAILAHGLDTIYPTENKGLAREIVEADGCLVTEYPLGEKPRRSHFVQRDRLQSGLRLGVVVVETEVGGGTMHTVGFCQEQGRPLACLSHPSQHADHAMVSGNRMLIESGVAVAVANPSDIAQFAQTVRLRHSTHGLNTPNTLFSEDE